MTSGWEIQIRVRATPALVSQHASPKKKRKKRREGAEMDAVNLQAPGGTTEFKVKLQLLSLLINYWLPVPPHRRRRLPANNLD